MILLYMYIFKAAFTTFENVQDAYCRYQIHATRIRDKLADMILFFFLIRAVKSTPYMSYRILTGINGARI